MIRIENVREMAKSDGLKRFLIDRHWPKGIIRFIPHKEESGSKKASLAEFKWCPQLAPRSETWKWFEANPDKIDVFRGRYFKELLSKKRHWLPMAAESRKKGITVLYDPRYSPWTPAHFFKEFLDRRSKDGKNGRSAPIKHVVHPGLGVAVPVEKAISRKGQRPLKEEMSFKREERLTFVPGEKRRARR